VEKTRRTLNRAICLPHLRSIRGELFEEDFRSALTFQVDDGIYLFQPSISTSPSLYVYTSRWQRHFHDDFSLPFSFTLQSIPKDRTSVSLWFECFWEMGNQEKMFVIVVFVWSFSLSVGIQNSQNVEWCTLPQRSFSPDYCGDSESISEHSESICERFWWAMLLNAMSVSDSSLTRRPQFQRDLLSVSHEQLVSFEGELQSRRPLNLNIIHHFRV
jgi:hypothetical protein